MLAGRTENGFGTSGSSFEFSICRIEIDTNSVIIPIINRVYEIGLVRDLRSFPKLQSIVNTSTAKPANQIVKPIIANMAGIDIRVSDTA